MPGCARSAAHSPRSMTPSTTSRFFAPTVSRPINRRLVVPGGAGEVVVGTTTSVFISIVAQGVPGARGDRARRFGLVLAMVMRLAMVAIPAWVVALAAPFFTLLGLGFSARGLVLIEVGL